MRRNPEDFNWLAFAFTNRPVVRHTRKTYLAGERREWLFFFRWKTFFPAMIGGRFWHCKHSPLVTPYTYNRSNPILISTVVPNRFIGRASFVRCHFLHNAVIVRIDFGSFDGVTVDLVVVVVNMLGFYDWCIQHPTSQEWIQSSNMDPDDDSDSCYRSHSIVPLVIANAGMGQWGSHSRKIYVSVLRFLLLLCCCSCVSPDTRSKKMDISRHHVWCGQDQILPSCVIILSRPIGWYHFLCLV